MSQRKPFFYQLLAFLVILPVIMISGCTSRPGPLYPPADSVRLADVQRLEFVNAYLQGKLCQAGILLAKSNDNYLAQDDFCSVSRNFLIAYKLTSYSGSPRKELLEKAFEAALFDHGCWPDLQESQDLLAGSDKDARYLDLIEEQNFMRLKRELHQEEDPLFASVYWRKSAQEAIKAYQKDLALEFVQQARAIDSAQGWVVFLIKDWKLLSQLDIESYDKDFIEKRIKILENALQICPNGPQYFPDPRTTDNP
ncbi:hypothetical protein [Desulfonatronovibrio hydrogenovorans]|uniref:hypothetical protein n=1 Tax=Desulfonatronovibrio hydrogenovorans TaxID=53245 RepID=UPI00048B04C0|nr:hypothetical protein [Desulfonatronovibrio hydrogenovorans]